MLYIHTNALKMVAVSVLFNVEIVCLAIQQEKKNASSGTSSTGSCANGNAAERSNLQICRLYNG